MTEFSRLERLPPYAFNIMDKLKAEIRASGNEVFDLGLGNPDLPTPSHIVEALRKAVLEPSFHRYTQARGIPELRQSIGDWYQRKFNVEIDAESEALVTLGSKEGLAHLALAVMDNGDKLVVPKPCYPIHHFGSVLAGADVHTIPFNDPVTFVTDLERSIDEMEVKPKLLIVNFPCNPTTKCVDLSFFEKIIKIAKKNKIWVVHDLAYAEITFDGYKVPSILQVDGAKDIACESYTLSKTYNMAGWRIGFMSGCKKLIDALAGIKTYVDYGSFAPLQYAAVAALDGPQECVTKLCAIYQKRRDVVCQKLQAMGFELEIPKASIFIWAKIPEKFRHLRSLEFAKSILANSNVVVAPGIGFGAEGDEYVRIGLVDNEKNLITAMDKIKDYLQSLEADLSGEMQNVTYK